MCVCVCVCVCVFGRMHAGLSLTKTLRRVEKEGYQTMSCSSHSQTRGGCRYSSVKIFLLKKVRGHEMTPNSTGSMFVDLFSPSPRTREMTIPIKRRGSPKVPEEPKIKKKPGPKPGWKNKFKSKGYPARYSLIHYLHSVSVKFNV